MMINLIIYCIFVLSIADSINELYNASPEGAAISGGWGIFIMPNIRIEYKEGQNLGECIYLKETDPYPHPSGQAVRKALFKCKCGNEFDAPIAKVKGGHRISCGCIVKPRVPIHGLSKHRINNVWQAIKWRCYKPDSEGYKGYGGRGIALFDGWINDLKAFYDYISNLPDYDKPGMTLDRIDNDGNYEPGNLRWVNMHIQATNTRIRVNNKSGYTGVSFRSDTKKWIASITLNYKYINLGCFSSPEEANSVRVEYLKKNNLNEYLNT